MAAYLIVDVDDLVLQFKNNGISLDYQELAVGLRGGAALAAGLATVDKLRAVAVANWDAYEQTGNKTLDPQFVFRAAGYDVFNVPDRDELADALIIHYFAFDPEPVNELIIATTSTDLIPLVRRVKTTASARVRVWGTWDVLAGTEFADEVIFQPFESLLGIQTKNVAVYIDFENIAISLSEQGFTVNLDHLIDRFVTQAKAHGQLILMSAYAPWGQRGSLPPLVDDVGREVAEEAPNRLMLANIEPVFNLPGKNSADIRIARDVMSQSNYEPADVYILASGDRDFNDVLNALVTKGKQVIVWGVRGSTSRQLEQNPGISVEYIEDFTNLQTHASFGAGLSPQEQAKPVDNFTPSQWSSLVIQFDRVADEREVNVLSIDSLIDRLVNVGAVVSEERGDDLVSQAMSLGLLKAVTANGRVALNSSHPTVEKTRLIRDRVVLRVKNTLRVRGWEYVNYGFLLKGLSMDPDLDSAGLNVNDQWRSHWIDALVREQILARELVPHRHNPDDLV
ncbi:MAG: NYN domain-containing protein, partial [Chloroflexota bacterium]